MEITSKAEEFTSEPAMKHFLENTPNENAAIWHQSIGVAGRADPNETAFYYRDTIIAREYLGYMDQSRRRAGKHPVDQGT